MKAFVREWAPLTVIVVLMLGARASLADHYTVPTGSMLPTVNLGDRVIVDKRAYGLRLPLSQHYLLRINEPTLGDVVVLDSPTDDRVLLKRVVGLPGQKVEVHEGHVTIDGESMPVWGNDEGLLEGLGTIRHLISLEHGGGPDHVIQLPADCYLVMGDNRGDSYDGRSFGCVQRGAILGRALGIYWRDGKPTWQRLQAR